jgi:ComF family protein
MPNARCVICASPLPTGNTCGECLERLPRYDHVIAAAEYAFPMDVLLQAYKYGGDLSLGPLLADKLAQAVRAEIHTAKVDAIVPMPLAPARLRERGFNQAQEIARHMGVALRLRVLTHACRKISDTATQATLPLSARAHNVRGAFVCDANVRGMRIAIVDDVMTSGASINELARNLKAAGAAHVSGWVVARTLR